LITFSVSWSTLAWTFFLIFLYGKCMQAGGIKFAHGKRWEPVTALGVVILFSACFAIATHVDLESIK